MPSQLTMMGIKGQVKIMTTYSFSSEQKGSDTSKAYYRTIRYFDKDGYMLWSQNRLIPYWDSDGPSLSRIVYNYDKPNTIEWSEYDSNGVASRMGVTRFLNPKEYRDSSVNLQDGQLMLLNSKLNENFRESEYDFLVVDADRDTLLNEHTSMLMEGGHVIAMYRHDIKRNEKDTTDLIGIQYDSHGNRTQTLIESRVTESKQFHMVYFQYY